MAQETDERLVNVTIMSTVGPFEN